MSSDSNIRPSDVVEGTESNKNSSQTSKQDILPSITTLIRPTMSEFESPFKRRNMQNKAPVPNCPLINIFKSEPEKAPPLAQSQPCQNPATSRSQPPDELDRKRLLTLTRTPPGPPPVASFSRQPRQDPATAETTGRQRRSKYANPEEKKAARLMQVREAMRRRRESQKNRLTANDAEKLRLHQIIDELEKQNTRLVRFLREKGLDSIYSQCYLSCSSKSDKKDNSDQGHDDPERKHDVSFLLN